jgi:amino acid adenylation domain-containing protein
MKGGKPTLSECCRAGTDPYDGGVLGVDTAGEGRVSATILDLFANQVRAHPSATALTVVAAHSPLPSSAADVSYAELDERSGRIARWLHDQGVGVEDVVAVELPRGPHLVAALIGILKAGAAYLAQEPGTPRARRERLATDARASALVTGPDPECRGLPTLRLPDDLARLSCGEPTAADTIGPENLAYICYTSGSTGRPKGVGVPHRAVVRLVRGDYADLGPGHTFLLLSPISFDAATFEIWAPLLTGGRLVIPPPGPLVAEALGAVVREHHVTTIFLTTALFHRMVDHDLEALDGLRQVLTGGEVLSPQHMNRFIDRYPQTRLIAAYGPTENTTFTSCHTLAGAIRTEWVPLGSPIGGTSMHILDCHLRPGAAGAGGELCVGGEGMSRGYVDDPVATAAAFVPDPNGVGARLYCTGDVVRQEPGGIAFIGRVDRQVKIRGFRVEPGEIEREISTIPGVREVVVVADGDREKRLTAYLVPRRDDDPVELVARVRRSLRETLPAAMIPSAFVTLGVLPLTAHGKVDRASLPVPERTAREADADFVPPRSTTEQLVCDMWAEALKVREVGVMDDFFQLGGHSLMAMDLIRQAETVFDVELPVRALLQQATIEAFAGAVDELIGRASASAPA